MMKNLLLILLLVNLGYYFLFMDRKGDAENDIVFTRGDTSIPLLVRVNELGEAPLPASTVPMGFDASTLEVTRRLPAEVDMNSSSFSPVSQEQEEATVDKVVQASKPEIDMGVGIEATCFTLGPFKDESVWQKVNDRLVKAGVKVKSRIDKKKITGAWWVYLPSFESRELAREASIILAENDVQDYFIIAKDAEMANGISLGLFSKKEGSSRRAEAIELLGFQPKVQRREREISTYWLDVTGESTLRDEVWKISEVSGKVDKKPMKCTP